MRFALPEHSPLPGTYNIVACISCGSVHADTHGSPADYERYYSDFSRYEDPSIATGGGELEFDAQRISETTNRLLPHLDDKGLYSSILDIGCARGGILKALRQQGFNKLHGIDPSPACVKHLQSVGISANTGNLSALNSQPDQTSFDLIILSHVLEHLLDLSTSLKALQRHLAPKGLIYIEVPDASRYLEYPAVPFYYFDCEHINHLSQETLHVLAKFHGFKVIASGENEISLPNKKKYPAVWALFTANPDVTSHSPSKPAGLADRVSAYIEQSKLAASYPTLEILAIKGSPVLLWGAGSYAQRLLEDSPLKQCQIVCVVDQDHNKQGQQFAGTSILQPENGLKDLTADSVIVVAAALYAEEICKRIRALGFLGEIVLPTASA